ncbi:SET [Sigmodon hispidus]
MPGSPRREQLKEVCADWREGEGAGRRGVGVCVPLSCKYPPRAGRLRGRLKSPAPEAASVPASFLLLRASALRPSAAGLLSRAMAPKRQSALLPQSKKPKSVPVSKLEDKSASPGLPKGGKFLHCVSLAIGSDWLCSPPALVELGPRKLSQRLSAGAAGRKADGEGAESAGLGARAQGTSSGPRHHVGPSLLFPAPKLACGASARVSTPPAILRLPPALQLPGLEG